MQFQKVLNELKITQFLNLYKNKDPRLAREKAKQILDDSGKQITFDQARNYARQAGLDPDKDSNLNSFLSSGTGSYTNDIERAKEIAKQNAAILANRKGATIAKDRLDLYHKRNPIPTRA